MTVKQFKELIAEINDDVYIEVSIPESGLDSSPAEANDFGQVLITLTKSPTME